MADTVELEIGLHHRDAESWSIELRGGVPQGDTEVRVVHSGACPDLDLLREHVLDTCQYGRLLTQSLFADPLVAKTFEEARTAAEGRDVPLRVRLFVGPSAAELHTLRWETLWDPDEDAPLFTGETVLFSRYLSSLDWRPVAVRPKTRLRAVVLAANPSGLCSWRPGGRELGPIDVAGELERARVALGEVEMVAGSGPEGHAGEPVGGAPGRLRHLVSRLPRVPGPGRCAERRRCHRAPAPPRDGSRHRGQGGGEHAGRAPAGDAQAAPAGRAGVLPERRRWWRPRRAVRRRAGRPRPPAGRSGDRRRPRHAGRHLGRHRQPVPPRFFQELHRDGQIDRAMAVARSAVRDRPDWWVPALFMRLKSGRIWYQPGFDQGFEKWPALVADIRKGRCTPILGPGLTDAVLGSRRELARRWASTYHFPLAPHAQEDLPQVAQFLAVNLNDRFPKDELADYVRRELLERYPDVLPDDARDGCLDDLMTAVGEWLRSTQEAEPHKVLAALPFPIYVTAHPANLLTAALRAEEKQPEVEVCRWSDTFRWPASIFDSQPGYRPDARRPLVFHLFGRLDQPRSVVLTEDDHFDYLIGVTSNRELIPPVVRRALADTSLLFLGFRMDEWGFRVLFRSIMNQEGRGRRRTYSHVAVQIDPEEGSTLEPDRARRYLESYFQGADITIYWGSVEDFVRKLKEEWERSAP